MYLIALLLTHCLWAPPASLELNASKAHWRERLAALTSLQARWRRLEKST